MLKFLCLLLISFCPILVNAVEPLCETSPPTWDWNDDFYIAIDDVVGGGYIPSPFQDGNSFGLNLAGQNHCYEDGWRLYQKKISCDDYGIDPDECGRFRLTSDSKVRPIFALYNIHLGLLRVFIDTEGFEIDDQELIIEYFVSQGSYGELNSGLLLNESSPVSVVSDTSAPVFSEMEKGRVVYPSLSNKWAVFDINLSYSGGDDYSLEKDLQFTFSLSRINSDSISVKGVLTLETNGTLSSAVSSESSYGFNDLKEVGNAYAQPREWAKQLESQARKLSNSESEKIRSLSDDVFSLSSIVASNAGPLGYLSSGFSIYDKFFGSSTKSSKSYINTYTNGAISAVGEITNIAPIELLALGVHGSDQSNSLDESSLKDSGYEGRLGLFAVNKKPRVVFSKIFSMDLSKYFHTFEVLGVPSLKAGDCGIDRCVTGFDMVSYSLVDNIPNIISINPDSGMVLKKYGLKPLLLIDLEYKKDYTASWEKYDFPAPGSEIGLYSYAYVLNDRYGYIAKCISESGDKGDCFGKEDMEMSSLNNKIGNEYLPNSMYFPWSFSVVSDEGEYRYIPGYVGGMRGVLVDKFIKRSATSLYGDSPDVNVSGVVEDFYIMLYMYLENKDNPEIYSEVYLKLPVDIGVCGSTEHNYNLIDNDYFKGHEKSDFFVPHEWQCSTLRSNNFYSPKRWDSYSVRNRLGIWSDSSSWKKNADQFCLEEGYSYAVSTQIGCGDDETSYSFFGSYNWERKESGSKNRCYDIYDKIECGGY